jgi:hypothetical protein
MAFTGPYPTKFIGLTDSMVISAKTFNGSVTNAGTIGPGAGVIITSSTFLTGGFVNTNLISGTANGISVLSDSTIHGAIVDSGTIRAAKDGILVSGGVVSGGFQVGGHGTISAGSTAILVESTTKFAGGITNSGAISAGTSNDGIFVNNVSSFSGGIRNNSGGRIAAGSSGIEVKLVTTFTGGISNAGTISSTRLSRVGIYLSMDAVFGASSGGGGIMNTGTISAAGGAGIDLFKVTTVFGSIVNAGKIIAAHGGIDVSTVSVFGAGSTAGGITNAGTIAAGHTGVFVSAATTFLGKIINASGGKIVAAASHHGILVSDVSTFGGSLAGGITNVGSISAGFNTIGVGGNGSGINVQFVGTAAAPCWSAMVLSMFSPAAAPTSPSSLPAAAALRSPTPTSPRMPSPARCQASVGSITPTMRSSSTWSRSPPPRIRSALATLQPPAAGR